MGGTGLYAIHELEIMAEKNVETPFGKPSAPLVVGRLGSQEVVFLPRHGKHHELLPNEINFRANIWALKSLGVQRVIAVSAVGSLEEAIAPGELVLPTQYFDWTKGKRVDTFFGEGLAAHISTAEPTCSVLIAQLKSAGHDVGISIHDRRTYACVEGPRLGTRAESFFLRDAGCHLVGMTNVPEAFLAREAQLCYCTLAVVTDYDCWMDDPSQHVSVNQVIARYKDTLGLVQKVLLKFFAGNFTASTTCHCSKSLEGAILTQETVLSGEKKRLLDFLQS